MVKSIFVGLTGLIFIYLFLLNSDTIHWPLLALMVTCFGIGYTNPTKGWIITIGLIIIVFIFGNTFESYSFVTANKIIVHFLCNIAFLPSLFGGFMGKYFSEIF
jgi:hypothetical protein